MYFLPLQFLECAYAMLRNTHARRCISLQQSYILITWKFQSLFSFQINIIKSPQKKVIKSSQCNGSQQSETSYLAYSICFGIKNLFFHFKSSLCQEKKTTSPIQNERCNIHTRHEIHLTPEHKMCMQRV
jgi:hypothetical protein